MEVSASGQDGRKRRLNRDDVLELHYMTPMANLRSLAVNGILSHAEADRIAHEVLDWPGVVVALVKFLRQFDVFSYAATDSWSRV